MRFPVAWCAAGKSETFSRRVAPPTGYGGHVERWRHALAIGFGIIGAIVAVVSGGDPAALSLALGAGLVACGKQGEAPKTEEKAAMADDTGTMAAPADEVDDLPF